jgi:hypothetical protein
VSQRGLNTDPQEADIEMDQEVFRESNRAVAEFAGLNPYPTHNFLAISSIYSRSDPRLHFIPPTVAIEDCLARSRSSRPAGCTTCRLPRASPGSGAASLAPARLALRAAPPAGCPEPPQAPVLRPPPPFSSRRRSGIQTKWCMVESENIWKRLLTPFELVFLDVG